MRKLVAELADQPYRVIVFKGPQAKEIELPKNMAGAEFLLRTLILPKVDPVITRHRPSDRIECAAVDP
jgi:UDP:flavonoid glycosyltransferase YjiC (YdhE family)